MVYCKTGCSETKVRAYACAGVSGAAYLPELDVALTLVGDWRFVRVCWSDLDHGL